MKTDRVYETPAPPPRQGLPKPENPDRPGVLPRHDFLLAWFELPRAAASENESGPAIRRERKFRTGDLP